MKKPLTAASGRQGKVRLVLVDDHPLMRQALRTVLEKYDDMDIVAEAGTGEEAVKLAADLLPDVMIMDIAMPGMSGLEATRVIKSAQPQIAILVLTVHEEPEVVFNILDAGAAGYLTKSVFGEGVVHAVRGVVAGETVLSLPITRLFLNRVARYKDRPVDLGNTEKLTPRELEILRLAAKGLSNKEISDAIGISVRTVKGYLSEVFAKLNVASRTEAVTLVLRAGIFRVEDLA